MSERILTSIMEVTLSTSVVIACLLLLIPWLTATYTVHWRYWVWMALSARLVLPVSFALPQSPLRIVLPSPSVPNGLSLQEQAAAIHVNEAVQTGSSAAVYPFASLSLYDWLVIVWGGGAVLTLLVHLAGYIWFQRSIRRWSRPPADPRVRELFEKELESRSLSGKVRLRIGKQLEGPMLTGFFKPTVWLPQETYRDHELQVIFKHELVHYQRRDLGYKLLLLAVQAIHWFNPLVHLMVRQADKDLEISCDTEVVKGKDLTYRRQYSETILAIMEAGQTRSSKLSTSFSGGKKTMERRFASILDLGTKRKGKLAMTTVLLFVIGSGILVACTAYTGSDKTTSASSDNQTRFNELVKSIQSRDGFGFEGLPWLITRQELIATRKISSYETGEDRLITAADILQDSPSLTQRVVYHFTDDQFVSGEYWLITSDKDRFAAWNQELKASLSQSLPQPTSNDLRVLEQADEAGTQGKVVAWQGTDGSRLSIHLGEAAPQGEEVSYVLQIKSSSPLPPRRSLLP
ncbi:M56 family metallopeptidase [Paenibacillus puerhi]|uniref:M56 family metallopeptidase n=1 Tax=Paenibacillus puerhi TaxID=2692622 RepID=UPI00135AF3C4|nr:M56 family metallopeptidase [Paenibacillus puerhi]